MNYLSLSQNHIINTTLVTFSTYSSTSTASSSPCTLIGLTTPLLYPPLVLPTMFRILSSTPTSLPLSTYSSSIQSQITGSSSVITITSSSAEFKKFILFTNYTGVPNNYRFFNTILSKDLSFVMHDMSINAQGRIYFTAYQVNADFARLNIDYYRTFEGFRFDMTCADPTNILTSVVNITDVTLFNSQKVLPKTSFTSIFRINGIGRTYFTGYNSYIVSGFFGNQIWAFFDDRCILPTGVKPEFIMKNALFTSDVPYEQTVLGNAPLLLVSITDRAIDNTTITLENFYMKNLVVSDSSFFNIELGPHSDLIVKNNTYENINIVNSRGFQIRGARNVTFQDFIFKNVTVGGNRIFESNAERFFFKNFTIDGLHGKTTLENSFELKYGGMIEFSSSTIKNIDATYNSAFFDFYASGQGSIEFKD